MNRRDADLPSTQCHSPGSPPYESAGRDGKCVALAQVTVPRVALVLPGSVRTELVKVEAFRQRLRELGYVEGKTLILDIRELQERFDNMSGFMGVRPLPKTPYSKRFHRGIVGDECCALDDGLRGERAVEWVAMFDVEPACLERMQV